MPIEIKMPALSPTMEEGTLAKWLVKEGDSVKSGDLLAEIETDKATMEFEAVDEGTIAKIVVAEGSDNVKVGAVIAILAEDGEDAGASEVPASEEPKQAKAEKSPLPSGASGRSGSQPDLNRPGDGSPDAGQGAQAPRGEGERDAPAVSASPSAANAAPPSPTGRGEDRVKASPLARRIAAEKGIEISALAGSGPNGRIVKADVEGAKPGDAPAQAGTVSAAELPSQGTPVVTGKPAAIPDIPHEATKLSNIRKTIARRLTESKQTVPHIYLTVDVRLDKLLKLRAELNAGLEARGVKLSVNDLLIKALAVSLIQVPKCNVMFTSDQLISFGRADISVAVSTPSGLITPIITAADTATLSDISTRMKDLAARARDGKLQPDEYQGGTASISNMGMYGIKQFDAVINPPQGMILAVGAGEKRPYVIDDALGVATVMSATGSFDHRAIDGADGAELMQAFKTLVEAPIAMLA